MIAGAAHLVRMHLVRMHLVRAHQMRNLLIWACLLLAGPTAARAAGTDYPAVVAGRTLTFPADYGSHPEYRTEWWYVTGWLKTADGEDLGFQVTFFRSRPEIADDNPSAFTPHQLIIAHAALSDPGRGRLWQDQRIRRAGFGLADAATGDTRVWIDQWHLQRDGERYQARIQGEEFGLELEFAPTQAVLLNGAAGVSRKGPATGAASYYYSVPHLRVSGRITRAGRSVAAGGEAWLDHEWSSAYLDPDAAGWDWIGINLDDGGALMAFQMRDAHHASRWRGGTYRSATGAVTVLTADDIAFTPLREWTSPRTGTRYPVDWQVRAGAQSFELRPLLDDQENDTRLSTGAIYWEGAVRALRGATSVGRGYLEMTGYGERLRLR